MLAEQITYLEGIWQQKATSDLAFYSGLVGPAKAARIPESRIKLDDLNLDDVLHDKSFQIRIDTASDLYLNYFADENSSYSLHFSRENGDFSCENAIIRFPTRIDVSGGEGVQANSQRLRIMGLNINGDLILDDWSSPARSSLIAPEPTFSIMKFTRKNDG
jgi:hypothetical protein